MKKFKINAAGAKIYEDANKHEMLKVPTISDPHNETGAIYDVLSVGLLGEQRIPIVTIRETKGIVAYRLPHDLSDWVHHAIALSMEGVKMFPEKVEFGILNNIAYAEIQ